MTPRARLMLRDCAFTAVAFTAALYLYYVVAFWGLRDHFVDGPIKQYLTSPAVHVEFVLTGVLFGALLGVIDRIAESPGIRRRSFIQVVALRTALCAAAFAVVWAIVLWVFLAWIWSWADVVANLRSMTLPYVASLVLWFVLSVVAINFLLEIRHLAGAGNGWRLLVGRYRRPRDEERVFLFMDLKGSTNAAEALGHRRYSEFIQECFKDLDPVALRYHASIYQYVGDEVVMSWPCEGTGDARLRSVRAFFAFERALAERRERYERRFDLAPEFRGGIDVGPVTATEIGDVKRAIAYHGDALNTAARLLELCKARGDRLVVSSAVGEAARADPGVRATWKGEVALRGKPRPVEVQSLTLRDLPVESPTLGPTEHGP